MLKKVSNGLCRVVEKFMPDPYIIAAILTIIVYIMAVTMTDATPLTAVEMWSGGLFGLLVFTMQISIALVMAGAIVGTAPVHRALKKLSSLATTPAKAYFITALAGGLGSIASWAIGLVVGGIVAKEMAKNVKGCHYPLLVASGYSGFVIWHMGYTSSIALVVAAPGHFLEEIVGVIPNSQTILTPFNLITMVILLIVGPILMTAMRPRPEQGDIVRVIDPALLEEPEKHVIDKKDFTFADKLENAYIINLLLGIAGLYACYKVFSSGVGLTMNSTNLTFLTLGLLLNKSPRQFIDNCTEGGRSLGPIVLQFPLYGGIMGLMVDSGLASIISNWFVSFSTVKTLPLFSYISAGVVNFFVPSGGSQWAVQGPIMMDAALKLGADPGRVAMAVAWGDQWTNMIQPFWALPLLAIAGMRARDIMGYCIVWLVLSGIIMGLGIMLL